MAKLSLQTSPGGAGTIVALAGELDLAGAAVLERELAALEGADQDTVVLDLRGVEFMDSSGLRVIATAAQRARALGRRLALVPGVEHVMRVFDVTRMRERLDFVDDPLEATAA